MEKKCKKCNEKKPLDSFRVNRRVCKKCLYKEAKDYREKNKHSEEFKKRKSAYDKKYNEKHSEKIKLKSKEYYNENKERLDEKNKKYYQNNKEQHLENNKAWRLSNPKRYEKIKDNYKERQSELRKARYLNNKEEENQKSKEYFKLNKDTKEYREKKQTYKKERKKKDPLFNLRVKIASRVYAAFKGQGYSKNTITQKMIGCSWVELQEHIQAQFTKDMTWDNYGDWQIDHIIPLGSSIDKDEMIKLCHFINLQPMWKEDNLAKKNKYEFEDKVKYLKLIEEHIRNNLTKLNQIIERNSDKIK